jgi:hypothetical protein
MIPLANRCMYSIESLPQNRTRSSLPPDSNLEPPELLEDCKTFSAIVRIGKTDVTIKLQPARCLRIK